MYRYHPNWGYAKGFCIVYCDIPFQSNKRRSHSKSLKPANLSSGSCNHSRRKPLRVIPGDRICVVGSNGIESKVDVLNQNNCFIGASSGDSVHTKSGIYTVKSISRGVAKASGKREL